MPAKHEIHIHSPRNTLRRYPMCGVCKLGLISLLTSNTDESYLKVHSPILSSASARHEDTLEGPAPLWGAVRIRFAVCLLPSRFTLAWCMLGKRYEGRAGFLRCDSNPKHSELKPNASLGTAT